MAKVGDDSIEPWLKLILIVKFADVAVHGYESALTDFSGHIMVIEVFVGIVINALVPQTNQLVECVVISCFGIHDQLIGMDHGYIEKCFGIHKVS